MLWLGSVNTHGYAVVHRNKREILIHRFVCKSASKVVRHKCDVRCCIERAHLLGGTQAENIADMVNRNRQARGEAASNTKLTQSIVLKIRELHYLGVSAKNLASRYGTTRRNIYSIVGGRTWKQALREIR